MSIISTTLLAPVETLINTVLAADPFSRERLSAMRPGRVLHVHCESPLPADLYVRTGESGLFLQGSHLGPVDCRLSGSAGALLRLLLSSEPRQALYDPGLSLSGDTDLASDLQRLARELDIDWEDRLAPLFGNVASHQLAGWLRSAQDQAEYSASRVQAMLRDYLHEEAALLPGRGEIDSLRSDTDALRLRIDRLQARVRELRKAVEK